MSLKNIINNWFHKNQHLFFSYKNGYYHLNYVANSPKSMLESFKKMMFCKFDKNTNIIKTNSPFNKGYLQFAFLEEGLSLMHTEFSYKKNVTYHQVISNHDANDYYTLSFNLFSNPNTDNSITMNTFGFSNMKWILTKPSFVSEVSYLKNSYSDNMLLYFNKKWLEDYVQKDINYEKSNIKTFFDSDEDFVVLPDNSVVLEKISQEIKQCLQQNAINNKLQLKLKTYELISTFISSYSLNSVQKNNSILKEKDDVKINQIVLYLNDNIENKFMGIDVLSEQFNISPTKLKSDFKMVYGIGIFNYFRQAQMHKAKDLLQNGNYRVKEVAQLFGYESISKFSRAFKTVNDLLPSEIIFSTKQYSS